MIVDKKILIEVKSSVIISKLKKIGIDAKIGQSIEIDISYLWKGSNIEIEAKCDICEEQKKIQFNLYNKNIKKYNIYTCSNKCSSFKNKLTNLERYGIENYINIDKTRKTKLERHGNEKYQNVEKIKETKLLNHGDENFNNVEKIKKTNLEKYGVEWSFLSDGVIEKIEKTNLEKYGVSDFRKSEVVKSKRKKTMNEKYGTDSFMKTDEFKEKSKLTNLNKYGVESSNQSDIIKEKKLQSMLKKYGFISNSCTEESKRKLKETNLSKYGVEYPMQVVEFFNKQQKNCKKIAKYNENLWYQGTYEKDFLDHMNHLGLLNGLTRGPSLEYEYEGKKKIYFPDFYYEELNLLIEIKSSYYFKKYEEKNLSKMHKCKSMGYSFLFIIDKNYNPLDSLLF
jgi:hypothetical protein